MPLEESLKIITSPKSKQESIENGALTGSLGHSSNQEVANLANVYIDRSEDVYFGDKNIYQGPVTIKKTVYANTKPHNSNNVEYSNPETSDNCDFGKETDNKKDSVSDLKAREQVNINGINNDSVKNPKCFTWLQNASKTRLVCLGILVAVLLLFIITLTIVLLKYSDPSSIFNEFKIINRSRWEALPPYNTTTPLKTPVPYVLIHHTATENCSTTPQCIIHVKLIEMFHRESRGFYDIGYNFLVGGDGSVFEGRGWIIEGAHSFGYNSKSIGIAFIGTFINIRPPNKQILACQTLIKEGVKLGYIQKDYKLLAARQLAATESPGALLYGDIKTWPHWAKEP